MQYRLEVFQTTELSSEVWQKMQKLWEPDHQRRMRTKPCPSSPSRPPWNGCQAGHVFTLCIRTEDQNQKKPRPECKEMRPECKEIALYISHPWNHYLRVGGTLGRLMCGRCGMIWHPMRCFQLPNSIPTPCRSQIVSSNYTIWGDWGGKVGVIRCNYLRFILGQGLPICCDSCLCIERQCMDMHGLFCWHSARSIKVW